MKCLQLVGLTGCQAHDVSGVPAQSQFDKAVVMQIPQRGAQDGREPAGSGGMAKAPRRLQEHPTSVKIRQTHRQAGPKRVGRNLLVAMSSDASKFADEAAGSQRITVKRGGERNQEAEEQERKSG